MIAEAGMHCPGAKVRRGRGLPVRKRPLDTFGTLPPFYRVCWTVFFTLSRLSFQDSLTLEEPVEVLKVGR